MIDSEVIKLLGKRAIATDCFEWRPGMLVLCSNPVDNHRIVSVEEDALYIRQNQTRFGRIQPDCSDPATIGCLLYLVRDLHKMPTIWTVERDGIWYCCWSGATHGGDLGSGASEAEALVSALEDFDYTANRIKK